MSVSTSMRIARGTYVHMSGSGTAAILILFSLIVAVIEFALTVLVVSVILIFIVMDHYDNQTRQKDRLQSLSEKSIDPSSITTDGNGAVPRTWGVYVVERIIKGERGQSFYFGNYPVRQRELLRRFGEAKLIALYNKRIDAEEVAYILNGGGHRG